MNKPRVPHWEYQDGSQSMHLIHISTELYIYSSVPIRSQSEH